MSRSGVPKPVSSAFLRVLRGKWVEPGDNMTSNLTIRNIRARPVLVPFKRPPMSASGPIPVAALVLIDLETEAGITGRSYVFGFAQWTLKPIVGCVEGLAGAIKGDACAPLELDAKLRRQAK